MSYKFLCRSISVSFHMLLASPTVSECLATGLALEGLDVQVNSDVSVQI